MKWPLLQDHQLACSWAGILSLHCQRSFSNSISTSPVLGQAVENLGEKKRKEKQTELWKVMVKLWGPLAVSSNFSDCRRDQKTKQETKISSLRTNPHLQPQEPISQCCKAFTQHNTDVWLGDLLHVLTEWINGSDHGPEATWQSTRCPGKKEAQSDCRMSRSISSLEGVKNRTQLAPKSPLILAARTWGVRQVTRPWFS